MLNDGTSRSADDVYWASQPSDQLCDELMDRVNVYFDRMVRRGFWDLMRNSYRAYYGLAEDGAHETSMVTYVGAQGEIAYLSIANYRNLVRHMLVLATEKSPAYEPRAINTDQKSLDQVPVARNVCEYFMREKRIDRVWRDSVEAALVLSLAYSWEIWDPMLGPVVRNDETGEQKHEGDIVVETLTPMDVITDLRRHPRKQDWRLVRRFANRFDLAARYPEMREKLLSLDANQADFRYVLSDDYGRDDDGRGNDDVPVWHFFHAKNNVMPDGRYTILAGRDCVLFDGPTPYRDIPVYPVYPSSMIGTGHTYANAWDLLGLCEAQSSLASTMLSINDRNGVGNIVAPQGTDIEAVDMAGRGRLLKFPAGLSAPEMMAKENVDGWVFNFWENIDKKLQLISGINGTIQGDPQANVKSGNFAALLERSALRFNGDVVGTAHEHAEDLGTGLIRILQDFPDEPMMIAVAGNDNTFEVKQFQSADIAQIDRVVVDVKDPFTATNEGKIAIADRLMDGKMITTAAEYLQVVQTGNLKPLYEREGTQRQLISTENERLAKGPPLGMNPTTGEPRVEGVAAHYTDPHHTHIQEHTTVIADLAVRENPDVVAAVNMHIREHFDLWRGMPSDLRAVLGIPEPPPPPGVVPTAQPPGAPQGPQQHPGEPQAQPAQRSPVREKPQEPTLPQPAQPPTGV